MRKIRNLVVISIILLIALTGCSNSKTSTIDDKLNSELEYMEDLIFEIANKNAKNEYVEDNEINWEYIKEDVKDINDSWNLLILDLNQIKIESTEILQFSSELNGLLIAVSDKNESLMISKLNEMYKNVINYKEFYSDNKLQIEKKRIKSGVLEVYSLLIQNQFEQARGKCDEIVENYKRMMNDENYQRENLYDLNKVYILLEELKNSVKTQNYELAKMRYITTIENI